MCVQYAFAVCVQFSISVWRFTLRRINFFVRNGMINQFSIFENRSNVERDSERAKENARRARNDNMENCKG